MKIILFILTYLTYFFSCLSFKNEKNMIEDYIQLTFQQERFTSIFDSLQLELSSQQQEQQQEEEQQEEERKQRTKEEYISIGCSNYDNGRIAAIKYSNKNQYEILISPYFVSIDDNVMCFIIHSQLIPSTLYFQEFQFILPFPSPMKIDGVYDIILNFWNPHLYPHSDIQLTEIPPSIIKLRKYFDNNYEMNELDNENKDNYDIYIAIFQFQYDLNDGSPNGNTSSLEVHSNNILNDVLQNLYCDHLDYSEKIAHRYGFKGRIGEKWKAYIQQQSNLDTNINPCSYESLQFRFHDNNIVISLESFLALRNISTRSTCLANLLFQFSIHPLVSNIELRSRILPLNVRSRGIQQTAIVGSSQQVSPYTAAGLTGAGVIVGVADTGLDENSCYFHDSNGKVTRSLNTAPIIDMSRRKVVQYSRLSSADTSDVTEGHGTHVCGTVAGDNTQNIYGDGQYNGVGYGARLAFLDIGDSNNVLYGPSITDEYPVLARGNAYIFTNSWGATFSGNGYYTGYNIDQYLYNNMEVVIFFAAGNSGLPSNGAGTITMEASAKNIVAVGASETTLSSSSIDNVAWFSSVGLTYDGRFKPDIISPGFSIQSVLSANSGSNSYTCNTIVKAGTSMASPGAAGIAALIRQYFTDYRFWIKICESGDPSCRSFIPSGVLIKTIIIHSGNVMKQYNAGSKGTIDISAGTPDKYQGFGRVQLSNALPLSGFSTFLLFVRDLVTIGEYSEKSRTFKVTGQSKPIKATLSWYDPPAAASITSKSLVNDLDLIILSPSNKIYYSNRLSNYDRKNNVEQIVIPSPSNGIWTVTVKSNALPYGQQQRFSISLTCIGLTLYNNENKEKEQYLNTFDDYNDSNSFDDDWSIKQSTILDNQDNKNDQNKEESEDDDIVPENNHNENKDENGDKNEDEDKSFLDFVLREIYLFFMFIF